MVVTQTSGDLVAVTEAFHLGDVTALADIYARWSPLVYSIALRSLGRVDQAEEVTKRVFVGAWALRESFDATRTQLPVWLIQITRAQLDHLSPAGSLIRLSNRAGR